MDITRYSIPLAWLLLATQGPGAPPATLPAPAVAQLSRSLDASRPHARHVWRDVEPINADGTVNGYVEIARGDRRKWEFSMPRNGRAIDRVIPAKIGGYPVNYGFVPQTVSYDGDPFDILILGPAIAGGTTVRGIVVGLMHMEDEKGLDSKVVVSPLAPDGRPKYGLTDGDRTRIGEYFKRYKSWEPGKFSRVSGWDSSERGLEYLRMTHAFFQECRGGADQECRLSR